jgi:hypothetical protein
LNKRVQGPGKQTQQQLVVTPISASNTAAADVV